NVCGAIAHGTVACSGGACVVGACDVNWGDCNNVDLDGCETNLLNDENNCGACGTTCNVLGGESCNQGVCSLAPPNPTNFNVLETKDIVYQGIGYLLVKVSFASTQSVAANWCYEYMNLCQWFGYVPTGCGNMYTQMNNGYGTCKTQYMS